MSAYHPPILDPDQWRPSSWLGGNDADDDNNAWTPALVNKYHQNHVDKKWVTKKGIVIEDTVVDGEVTKKGCPEHKRTQVEQVAHDALILRDCWTTPLIVWEVVELFFGRKIITDPFWNPWGALHPEVRLDGSPGFDGFAVDDNDAPKYWRGPVGGNHPHSATTRTPDVPEGSAEKYKKGGALQLFHEYGKTEQCAAVLPQRGDDALWHYGMSCDTVLEFGRLNFDPPPGVRATTNPGCTIVLLWLPDRKCSAPARRLFEKGSYRFEIPWTSKHRRTGRRAKEILVRTGVPTYNRETDNIMGVEDE